MPSPDALLAGLSAITNDWRWLAIAWHFLLAVLCGAIIVGWRPRARLLGRVLVAPLLSVSVVAWVSGNPFNGTMFAVLGAALVWSVHWFDNATVTVERSERVAVGIAIVLFGWTYPHFVRTESWMTYAYASPFGILPCPTLAVVVGLTLIVRHVNSPSWQAALAAAGRLYGVIGVFRLGVVLDWGLLLASATLGAALARDLVVVSFPPLIRILR